MIYLPFANVADFASRDDCSRSFRFFTSASADLTILSKVLLAEFMPVVAAKF